ncbi:hypothetical protein L1987_83438 [Smallanthus sonchifolius]|uniref:Uncharacterized protein n=1 Tax=Smallanthus sonchifolius TaxID=185202 RepID=A0ACB8YC59_9ASTR|nr:hypothetical protein L1987_83438 [Smallanthus sonchifolius]
MVEYVWKELDRISTLTQQPIMISLQWSYNKSVMLLFRDKLGNNRARIHNSSHGQKVFLGGGSSVDGPPTPLCGTSIDQIVIAQATSPRDNTKLVNGAIIVATGIGKPQPPMLVLHDHYGGYVGSLPSYDALPLGGPCSIRGFNMGGIGASRFQLADSLSQQTPLPVILETMDYFFSNVISNIFTSINELKVVSDGHMTSISDNCSSLRAHSCTQFFTSVLTDKDSFITDLFTFDFLDSLPAYTQVTLRPLPYPHLPKTVIT